MKNVQLFFLRLFFSISGKWFPKFTLNKFWNLIFSIRRKPIKAFKKAIFQKAESAIFFIKDPFRKGKELGVRAYIWDNPGQTVLLVHGWEGDSSDFHNFIPGLLQQGYRVITFDAPGHGRSEGSKSSLPHFLAAMTSITDKFGKPDLMIGHSMGGTASALFLSEIETSVEKLVMISSPLVPKDFFSEVSRFLRVPKQIEQQFYKRLKATIGRPVDVFDLFRFAGKIKAKKQLYIVDEKDHLVKILDAKKFIALNQPMSGQITCGLGHYRTARDSGVLQIILNFFSEKEQRKSVKPKKKQLAFMP
ncbi:MAG: alpha/beta fold hydrolase [Bacteroidota bacterium]